MAGTPQESRALTVKENYSQTDQSKQRASLHLNTIRTHTKAIHVQTEEPLQVVPRHCRFLADKLAGHSPKPFVPHQVTRKSTLPGRIRHAHTHHLNAVRSFRRISCPWAPIPLSAFSTFLGILIISTLLTYIGNPELFLSLVYILVMSSGTVSDPGWFLGQELDSL